MCILKLTTRLGATLYLVLAKLQIKCSLHFTFSESSQHSSRYDLHLDENDGFSPSEVEFFKEQISTMDKSMKDYITNPDVTAIDRYEITIYCYFIFFRIKS